MTISLKLKVSNPLYRAILTATDKSVSFTSIERQIDDNCQRLRAFIHKYIQQRKTGTKKSYVANSADLLSLFFETPEIFTDEFIVDELADFFFAATATTQNTSQTIVGHFATAAESLSKVRAEFNELCKEDDNQDFDSTDRLTFLKNQVSCGKCQDMTYLGHILNECLRYMPPVPHSSSSALAEDATIGKHLIRAGDIVQVNIQGLHFNKNHWQRPHEFLPDRFDAQNPLSLTPDGKKRKAMAFCPFLGGKRVCFGKTFADLNLRVVAVYMSQLFDLKFVDQDTYPDTHSLPMA